MTSTFATISILMGVLMLASKSRKRFPCFAGGCCALLAGGFILGFPILNSIQILGWIWFCVWLAALPSLLACVIALGVLASRKKATVSCVAFGVVAVLANIQPSFDFWSAAASGVVDATPLMKKTNNRPRLLTGHQLSDFTSTTLQSRPVGALLTLRRKK